MSANSIWSTDIATALTHVNVYTVEHLSPMTRVEVGIPPLDVTGVVLETVRVVVYVILTVLLEEHVQKVGRQRNLWPSACTQVSNECSQLECRREYTLFKAW